MTVPASPLNLDTWQPPELTQPQGALSTPVDARGADWRGMSLSDVDLRGAHLCRSDLRGANLAGANLADANLARARADGASLAIANLEHARLNDASLAGADLGSARLEEAEIAEESEAAAPDDTDFLEPLPIEPKRTGRRRSLLRRHTRPVT